MKSPAWPSELRYAVGRATTLETLEEALVSIQFSYTHEAVTDQEFELCLQLSAELGRKARALRVPFAPESWRPDPAICMEVM